MLIHMMMAAALAGPAQAEQATVDQATAERRAAADARWAESKRREAEIMAEIASTRREMRSTTKQLCGRRDAYLEAYDMSGPQERDMLRETCATRPAARRVRR